MLNEYTKDFRGAIASLFAKQVHNYSYCAQTFMMFGARMKLHTYKLQLA
jgi:hypothetical protein